MTFHAKNVWVQHHYLLGSMKQMDLLKFMMKLDIQYYLVIVGMIKLVIDLNIKSVVKKNENKYYYNIFLEKGSHKDKSNTQYF